MFAETRHSHCTTWNRWLCDSVSVSSLLVFCYGSFSVTFLFCNGAPGDVVLIIFRISSQLLFSNVCICVVMSYIIPHLLLHHLPYPNLL